MNDDENRVLVTKSKLRAGLADLGISAGQAVMLHVSVKAIGWVVGGPDVVLDALLELLTPAGTLMMMVDWEDTPYELPEWTPERQHAYRNECPPFDPAASRANWQEMSIVSEYLRTRPGAYRSNRPSGSMAAVGASAEWLVQDHPWHYGFGPGSPLAKLCELGGQVLNIGAPLDTFTILHYAEHLADVPEKRIVRYEMPVLIDGQRVWKEVEEFDTSNGIVDYPGDVDYFALIAQAFLESGQSRSGKVGEADAHLIDADALCRFGIHWIETHFK